MRGLSYTSPGFPVYRALTVPRLVDGKFENISELTDDVIRSWENILQGLREYLSNYRSIIENLKNKPIGHEYYETLADIIALYFRQPLQLDPIPSTMVSPLKIYSVIRKIKSVYDVYKDDPIATLEYLTDITPEKPQREVIDNLVKCWLRLPADTRPGHNTSGLIPHLLTTSAIAWALAIEENLGRTEAAKAKLAALLHDMSKPFNYRKHWKITDRVVDLVLDREVLGSVFVDELAQLVRKHHIRSGDVLGNIIHRADKIASSVDRLGKFAKEILKKELGDRFEILYRGGEEAWDGWERLERESPGIVKELSSKFVNEVIKMIRPDDGEVVEGGKLLYFLVDVGGVQEFIFRTVDLRTVAASSYIVDFITSAHIMMGLQHHLEKNNGVWMPVESFLIYGGGNLSFIAPKLLKDPIINCLKHINEKLEESPGLRLHFGYAPLTDNFIKTRTDAARAVTLQKIKHEKYAKTDYIPQELCKYCYSRTIENEKEKACNRCLKFRNDIGNEFHFRRKWTSGIILMCDSIEIPPIKQEYSPELDLMYVITGHSPGEVDAVQQRRIRKRNVAVVKFDANMMGKFFAQSISLTDALERSWRVDMSMKMAYQQALADMYEAVKSLASADMAELAVQQCNLGTLYIGGDDGLVICPSWASIPLAIGISKYFHEGMGRVLTLGVGLAVTTPEHDVWSSIEAASELLEIAKKAGRKITNPSEGFGALCFDIIEGGTLSKSAVKSRHYELMKEKLTVQPFILGGDDRLNRFDTVLENILETRASNLHELYEKCWIASRDKLEENDLQRTLKKIRSALKEPPEIIKTSKELTIKLSFTYFNRQISRLEKEDPSVKAYKMVVNAVREYLRTGEESKLLTPLADIDRLVKIVGGGVI